MTIQLIIKSLDTDCGLAEHVLEDLVISVGRSQGCTVELEHNEVSRRHFIIKYEHKAYFIVDEGSSHGTWLNDVRLEHGQRYPLGALEKVAIPGFVIELRSDNQAPKAEKTTVVARKIMGKIFEDLSMREEVPYLLDKATGFRFFFNDAQSSFVLGRAHHLDFVVEDELINKEHLSFIRDINGVRAIIINNAALLVNGQAMTDSVILHHGDLLKVGSTEFCFLEHDDESLLEESLTKMASEASEPEPCTPAPILPVMPAAMPPVPKPKLLRNLDQIFFALFIFVACGISWLWLKMT